MNSKRHEMKLREYYAVETDLCLTFPPFCYVCVVFLFCFVASNVEVWLVIVMIKIVMMMIRIEMIMVMMRKSRMI